MKIPESLSTASRYAATKSAMNPIIWILAICTPSGLLAMEFMPFPLDIVPLFISIAPVCAAIYGFIYFLHINPDRLQSEQYLQNIKIIDQQRILSENVPNSSVVIDLNNVSDNPLLDGKGHE